MSLNHINVYLLNDGDAWTIVDTGLKTTEAMDIWQLLLRDFLGSKPISRVILTHHHPDHTGLAGWLLEKSNGSGKLVAPRTAWALARMMQMDPMVPMPPALYDYFGRAGMEDKLKQAVFERGFAGAFKMVHPLPIINSNLSEYDYLQAAGRQWQVIFGHGPRARSRLFVVPR